MLNENDTTAFFFPILPNKKTILCGMAFFES